MSASGAHPRSRTRLYWAPILAIGAMLIGVYGVAGGLPAISALTTLRVPGQYPTIQSAINAAPTGAIIAIGPGTYPEQLTIDKTLSLTGSGVGRTIIQSPTVLRSDAFGALWTIEAGGGAVVTLSGVTVMVTLECLATPTTAEYSQAGYAGGGIGVGGGATLNLVSSAITTASSLEGGSCLPPPPATSGRMSYGTGISFGLDVARGGAPVSALVGSGTVTGVTISGFGFDGPSIAVGGWVDSPSGSHAVLSNDHVLMTTDPVSPRPPIGIAVGAGGNASVATVSNSFVSGGVGTSSVLLFGASAGTTLSVSHTSLIGTGSGNAISVQHGAVATITGNQIHPGTGAGAFGIEVEQGFATIVGNSILGPTGGEGIWMFQSSAVIQGNTIGLFECSFYPGFQGLCGPHSTQIAANGIFDGLDAGHGTTITNNVIYSTDEAIYLYGGCPGCAVDQNTIQNSVYYGLVGEDGVFSFGPNVVIGGMYGVAAVAFSVDTLVNVDAEVFGGQSVGPWYAEVDFPGGTAGVVGPGITT